VDTWVNLQATNGFAGDFITPTTNAYYLVAPPGTTVVRYQVTMHVLGGSGGILYDQMSLWKKLQVKLNASVSGGSINISWLTQGSTSYQVVYRDNLTDPNWTPIGGAVAGDGTTKSVSFPTTGSKRFYSVITQ